jgi:hypothetical protein
VFELRDFTLVSRVLNQGLVIMEVIEPHGARSSAAALDNFVGPAMAVIGSLGKSQDLVLALSDVHE